MSIRRKVVLGLSIFLILGTTGIILSKDKKAPPVSVKPIQPVLAAKTTPPPKETYESCIGKAEQNYQNFVVTNGLSATNNYSEKFQSLTDQQEAHVNAVRAEAYGQCFTLYGS